MKRTLSAVLSIVCITLLIYPMAPSKASAEETGTQKAVLVTGASSGIGRKITEKLASEGVFVYAGARKDADITALNEIENVQAIRLDVTVQEQIDAAVITVADGERGLYAVVNNAGVNVMGPLIEIDESELDFLFGVNIYGPYRVTKAFAPMIIESKGRISNISSISGTLSGGLYGVYAMSKHALEAYTDALSREMQIFDVKVSAVEPGNYKTQIFHSRCDRLLEQGYNPETSRYTEFVTRMYGTCKERPVDTDPEPDQVADAVYSALFDEKPKEHYMVVPAQEQAGWTIGKAVEELVSLNQGHQYSYSREQLIEMLDAEIARQNALVAVE